MLLLRHGSTEKHKYSIREDYIIYSHWRFYALIGPAPVGNCTVVADPAFGYVIWTLWPFKVLSLTIYRFCHQWNLPAQPKIAVAGLPSPIPLWYSESNSDAGSCPLNSSEMILLHLSLWDLVLEGNPTQVLNYYTEQYVVLWHFETEGQAYLSWFPLKKKPNKKLKSP